MAVQAPHSAIALPDLPARTSQHENIENRSFLNLISYGPSSRLEDIQHSVVSGAAAVQSHQRLFQPGFSLPNVLFLPQPLLDSTTNPAGVKKRRRVSNARRTPQQKQQRAAIPLVDLNQAHGSSVAPQSGVVSIGLRLAFDDDRSSVTSSKPDMAFAAHAILRDELSAQFSQQQEELDQFLRSQADQLRLALEERRQRHSEALIASIEESVARRIRENEVELEKVNRRNRDLEEQVKLLSVETHMWQSKAKSNEAMVSILKTNLQQAVVQSRDQSKIEGCGDSEADDAASAHLDGNAEAQARFLTGKRDQGELLRACKRCRSKEVSILLLPCLHLCLCNDCKGEVERCPVCNSLSSWSIEVYLS